MANFQPPSALNECPAKLSVSDNAREVESEAMRCGPQHSMMDSIKAAQAKMDIRKTEMPPIMAYGAKMDSFAALDAKMDSFAALDAKMDSFDALDAKMDSFDALDAKMDSLDPFNAEVNAVVKPFLAGHGAKMDAVDALVAKISATALNNPHLMKQAADYIGLLETTRHPMGMPRPPPRKTLGAKDIVRRAYRNSMRAQNTAQRAEDGAWSVPESARRAQESALRVQESARRVQESALSAKDITP